MPRAQPSPPESPAKRTSSSGPTRLPLVWDAATRSPPTRASRSTSPPSLRPAGVSRSTRRWVERSPSARASRRRTARCSWAATAAVSRLATGSPSARTPWSPSRRQQALWNGHRLPRLRLRLDPAGRHGCSQQRDHHRQQARGHRPVVMESVAGKSPCPLCSTPDVEPAAGLEHDRLGAGFLPHAAGPGSGILDDRRERVVVDRPRTYLGQRAASTR